jgi:hypothetical protein
LYM